MTDDELRSMLHEWKAPPAPALLRQKVLRVRRFSWRWWWSGELRVPVPVAMAVALCLMLLGVYAVMRPSRGTGLSDFDQVTRFEPRIVRTTYEQTR